MHILRKIALRTAQAILASLACYAVWTIPSLLPRWGASSPGLLLALLWIAVAAVAWPIARGRIAGAGYIAALVGTALAFRLAALPIMGHGIPLGDPAVYPELARAVLGGRGLVETDLVTHVPMRALFPPTYPLLLAALGAVAGLGTPALWASNTALDLLGAWQIARIGRRLGAPAAGRAGAWLYAIWPSIALATPIAQKEPLETVLVLAIVLMLLRLSRRPLPGWGHATALGALGGALALTQPGIAPLPVLLALALMPLTGFRPMLLQGLRAAPALLLVMAPWWARNMLLFDQFVPLTTTSGISLWIGNNPYATGNWMPLPHAFVGMPELLQSHDAGQLAREWMRAHPGRVAVLTLTKLVRACAVDQATLGRLAGMRPAASAAVLAALFPLLQTALFAILAAGAALTARAARSPTGAVLFRLVVACAVQLGAISVWFEFGERHRYFAMPFLFLLIGRGLATLPIPVARLSLLWDGTIARRRMSTDAGRPALRRAAFAVADDEDRSAQPVPIMPRMRRSRSAMLNGLVRTCMPSSR